MPHHSGIPGIQCFKIAGLQLAPFGRRVVGDGEGSTMGVLGNVLWVLLIGGSWLSGTWPWGSCSRLR